MECAPDFAPKASRAIRPFLGDGDRLPRDGPVAGSVASLTFFGFLWVSLSSGSPRESGIGNRKSDCFVKSRRRDF